ncbi:dynein light chain Tctex-type 5-A-like [Oculina patagonica]
MNNSLEVTNMADASGKSKVRKTSLPLASTRSFFVKKPPQAPLNQQQGYDGVRLKSGSSFRDDELLEELEHTGQAESVVLENTYRVGPDPLKKFSSGAVKRIAEEILVKRLTDVIYEPKVCRDLTVQISDEVKSQVKLLGFDRYKIVCVMHIGPKMGQAIRIGSMCCWDEKADNFAECSFINNSLFAVALIFGIYQE